MYDRVLKFELPGEAEIVGFADEVVFTKTSGIEELLTGEAIGIIQLNQAAIGSP